MFDIPCCPVVHHGLMSPEPTADPRDGGEWFCMVCGRRLYGSLPEPYTGGATELKYRADDMTRAELREWVKKLRGDGYSVFVVSQIVHRDQGVVRGLLRGMPAPVKS